MAHEENERRPQGVPRNGHDERHEHACDHGISIAASFPTFSTASDAVAEQA